jgi:hypothetical protein
MDLKMLNQLMSEVYIILTWGLGSPQDRATPNRQLATRVYRASWVDTKADRATYNVGAMIRRVAPRLNEAQGIELTLECHRALLVNVSTISSMQEVPQGLRKYVR